MANSRTVVNDGTNGEHGTSEILGLVVRRSTSLTLFHLPRLMCVSSMSVVDLTDDVYEGAAGAGHEQAAAVPEDLTLHLDFAHNQRFPLRQLKCLLGQRWLDDEVLNAYAGVICGQYETGCVDSLCVQLWWQAGRIPAAVVRDPRRVRFFVINELRLHWSLIEVLHYSRIIVWYNSHHPPGKLQPLVAAVFPDYEWRYIDRPVQSDSTECGVMVANFILQRLRDLRPCDDLILPPPNFRNVIAQQLLDASIDTWTHARYPMWRDVCDRFCDYWEML